ncbi:hypothetical protein K0B96_02600 [Horticoccus luteus]|uniref:Uncharacterized protein n=1 Tax=Horticoccus luteus TaxID=2862869 RepID=A0A8F9XHN6_9BACT|nr:hypothetical protein [Horticoccus luteus]QYM79525.1 hypothetical protein K0B96_02600 [Horticoccus luteus]
MVRSPPRRLRLFFFALALACLASATFTPAQEVQHHGLVFERWVDDTFFDGYRPPSYTQKWDIPASANKRYGGVPVNPKATKFHTPVDLGDALRQFDIAESFMLVIGYWQQEGDAKRFVNIVAPRIDPAAWRKLWGPVTRADLARLDAVIKDRSLTPQQARAAAARMKREPPFTECVFVLNPKIDSKTQRRLQCSLRFDDVFRHLAPDADRSAQEHPALFGVPFPAVVPSKSRTIHAPQ